MTEASGPKDKWPAMFPKGIGNGIEKKAPLCAQDILPMESKQASGQHLTKKEIYIR